MVTEQEIMDLIVPHLEDEFIKMELVGVLKLMKIARLPDARQKQYAELYYRFSKVIEEYTVADPINGGGHG